jgi:hypothetical protein
LAIIISISSLYPEVPVDNKDVSKRLNPEEFVCKFIVTFRDTERSRGIHTVFSGFNAAFKEYFPSLDPVAVTTALADAGKIDLKPARRGVMIYLPGESPTPRVDTSKLLKKMGLEK